MSYRTRPNKLRRPSTAVVIGDVYPRGPFGHALSPGTPPWVESSPHVHQQSGTSLLGGARRTAQVNTQAPVLRETASTGAFPYYLYERSAG